MNDMTRQEICNALGAEGWNEVAGAYLGWPLEQIWREVDYLLEGPSAENRELAECIYQELS